MPEKRYNSISVVVPAYNESNNLKKSIFELNSYLSKLFKKYEIIIVESASTDDTAKIADFLQKKLKNVLVIHQKQKLGYGNAIRQGYKKSKYSLVWYNDADRPYDLKALENALALIDNADAVIGYKVGKRESFSRWFFSLGYNLLIRTIFWINLRDINFSFKLVKKEVLDQLDLRSDGWFIDGELLSELSRKKMKIKEIPIKYNIRQEGNSKVVIRPKMIFGFLKEMYYYKTRNKRD